VRTFNASLRPPLGRSLSPARRSPESKDQVHPTVERRPFRVSFLLSPPGLVRPGSPSWVPTPFNGIHLRAPSWSRSFATHPGSALELSQLLSGLCKQAFHGLVSCRNRSWTAFPRAFPSQGSRAPLGVALPPCGYPPSCEARLTLTLSPPVSFDSLAPGAAPPTGLPKPADLTDSTPFWGALAEFPRRL
jgi:hypothetical protein